MYYEVVGIDPTVLDILRVELALLPNKIAKCAYLRQFQVDNPSVDVRLMITEIRTDEARPGRVRAKRNLYRHDVATYTGDGCNMRGASGGGKTFLVDHLWFAGVPSNGKPRKEPVIGCLDQQPGKYGTNTQILRTPDSFTGLHGR